MRAKGGRFDSEEEFNSSPLGRDQIRCARTCTPHPRTHFPTLESKRSNLLFRPVLQTTTTTLARRKDRPHTHIKKHAGIHAGYSTGTSFEAFRTASAMHLTSPAVDIPFHRWGIADASAMHCARDQHFVSIPLDYPSLPRTLIGSCTAGSQTLRPWTFELACCMLFSTFRFQTSCRAINRGRHPTFTFQCHAKGPRKISFLDLEPSHPVNASIEEAGMLHGRRTVLSRRWRCVDRRRWAIPTGKYSVCIISSWPLFCLQIPAFESFDTFVHQNESYARRSRRSRHTRAQ
jgi:hypothetical protein